MEWLRIKAQPTHNKKGATMAPFLFYASARRSQNVSNSPSQLSAECFSPTTFHRPVIVALLISTVQPRTIRAFKNVRTSAPSSVLMGLSIKPVSGEIVIFGGESV